VPEIDRLLIETFEPGMLVLISKEEEEPLDFDAAAVGQKVCKRRGLRLMGHSLREGR
jgi:hypothetical protein